MEIKRKAAVTTCLVLAVMTILSYGVLAQEKFPDKPVKFIVSMAAGGGNDIELRMLQPPLEKALGAPIVIENRGGAGSQIANTLVHRSPADGYTVLYTNWEYLVLTTILQKPDYRVQDFEPLVVQLVDPRIMMVLKNSPYNSVTDFINAAKASPGKLAVSVSQGGNQHLLMLALRNLLKLDFRIVGYPGGGPARANMLGGHVDASMAEVQGGYYLRAQTKALGIFSDSINPLWPEAKPVNEQLKPFGVEIPELARHALYMVRADVKSKYSTRYARLRDALVSASKDPGYLEAAKKATLDSLLVFAPAERYADTFKRQLEFFEQTREWWKE